MPNKISIIIPVYNAEDYLTRCLESIQNQSYSNLEIILINDGSTDSSPEICKEFNKKDNRFKIIHQINAGTSSARNKGLKLATGDYIGFVDSDDYIMPDMYEKMINCALSKNQELITCQYVTSNKSLVGLRNPYDSSVVTIDTYLEEMKYNPHGIFNVWNKIYSTNLAKSTSFICNKIHQDALYISEILANINHIGIIKEPLYVYNMENESITRSKYNQKRVDGIQVVIQAHHNLQKIAKRANSLEAINLWFNEFLFGHYGKLSINTNLDKDDKIKEELIRLIKLHKMKGTKDFRFKLAILTNTFFYGLIMKISIKIKNKFRH